MHAAPGDHTLDESPPRRWIDRHSTALWIALGVAVALLLRAPWFDSALGRDEGGVAMVARAWHGSGPFAYGSYFLDRPPLLPALYRLAGDGDTGIRVLGAIASALLVAISTLLAVRLAGRRAAPWAAGISAVLASSFAIKSVFTPAELLAVVPSGASVLLLVIALERSSRRFWLFAGAGALAATALLVKQSFGDALVAGAAALVAGKLLGASWRETARRAVAYAAGGMVLVVALVVWAAVMHTSAHSIWYAMFGFRIDATAALTGHGVSTRLSRLESPFLTSGLAVAGLFAAVGIARLSARPVVRLTLAAWLVAAGAGILLGGSYWPHYLIALVPGAAAGAAAVFQRYRLVGVLALCAIAVPTVVNAVDVGGSDSADNFQADTVTIGHYIRARALPNQTAYALYARVNALYYTGLPNPYPYNWSLMMRAAPGARDRLRRLLDSPGRPTWVLKVGSISAYGLDRDGTTKRLFALHYRRVDTVCGVPVFLARGAAALPPPAGPLDCGLASARGGGI
jgi:4-amino-4-deoxy-L-arabinose transferase-like glycosyltransferase